MAEVSYIAIIIHCSAIFMSKHRILFTIITVIKMKLFIEEK